MSITSNMFMYSLTLRPAGMITKAIVGNFIPGSTREQQILVASGERLTLNVVARKTGRFQTLLSHNVFGIIRNISACRIPGTPQGEFWYIRELSKLHVVILEASRTAQSSYWERCAP